MRYEGELGLVPGDERRSGQRRYYASSVDRVGMIQLLRDIGVTLAEITAP